MFRSIAIIASGDRSAYSDGCETWITTSSAVATIRGAAIGCAAGSRKSSASDALAASGLTCLTTDIATADGGSAGNRAANSRAARGDPAERIAAD